MGTSSSSDMSGTSGITGASGLSDTTGTTGYTGTSGASDYSGTTGTSGYSGTTGTSGYSGSAGSSNADNEESGISKFFKNLFGSDNDESERFSKVAGQGTVVTVHARTADEAEEVADLLDDYGAIDVDDTYNQQYAGNTGGTSYTGTTGNQYNNTADFSTDTTAGTSDNTSRSIPIIEENLQVGKKEVSTGGVRLRSRIVEKPVEESLRLREEYVRVERNPVDRPATQADLDNFQEGTVEMRETAEIPVVAKEARVVEEVSLDKEVEHREETIRDTVRRTEVDVEQLNSNVNRKSDLDQTDNLSSSSDRI